MKTENNVLAAVVIANMEQVVTEIATRIATQANTEIDEVNKAHEAHEALLGEKIAEQTQEISDLKALNEQAESALRQAKATLAATATEHEVLKKQIEALKSGNGVSEIRETTAVEEQVVTSSSSEGKLKHEKFERILALVKAGIPVFMSGEAGVGKNVIAEQVAEAMGLPFYMSSKLNDEYGIRGYGDANGRYVETPFYKAFKEGGVFLLDEMDASSSQALVALNTALSSDYYDFPIVGNVKKHPNFRVLANGNTNGSGATEDYNGREALDKSTLDRFAFVEIGYDSKIELACADGDTELVNFIHDCRNACKKMHSNVVLLSYRGISNFKSIQAMSVFTLCEVMETTLLKGIDRDNIELLHNNLSQKTNRYAKVLNDCIWHLSQAA